MPHKRKDPVKEKLRQARVARMATVDREGRPHIVPVCFAYDGAAFYTAIDLKAKRTAPEKLARLRNIQSRTSVALLIDEYGEDWKRLWYVQVRGKAELLALSDRNRSKALRLLRMKYSQYAAGLLPHDAPIIRILPGKIVSWGNM